MTKPIEWRLPDKTETKTIPGKSVRLGVYVPAEGYLLRWATPSDLASALAAMGEGERAEVLAGLDYVILAKGSSVVSTLNAETKRADLATARAETAERECAKKDEALALVRMQREKAERERDEAREERDQARESARESTAYGNSMQAERGVANRRWAEAEKEKLAMAATVSELRSRLIAVETAAAQREPREYPLAEGSKWIDNVIRDADGSQSWVAGGQVVTDGPLTAGLRYTYRQSARNLAALLHRAGVV